MDADQLIEELLPQWLQGFHARDREQEFSKLGQGKTYDALDVTWAFDTRRGAQVQMLDGERRARRKFDGNASAMGMPKQQDALFQFFFWNVGTYPVLHPISVVIHRPGLLWLWLIAEARKVGGQDFDWLPTECLA